MASPLPDSGNLTATPLPRLLLDLYRERWSGTLHLERGHTHKRFGIRDGAPISSESSIAGESLAHQLAAAGAIASGDRLAVEKKVRSSRCAEAAALLQLQLIEPTALFKALKEQLRRRLIECFGWVEGDFELLPGEGAEGDVQAFRSDPYRIVQDGLEGHWGPERIFESLSERLDRYPSATPALGAVARRLELDATVERLLAGLSGTRTLGAAIGAAAGSPRALAAFWVLDAAGALQYSDEPVRATDPAEQEAPPEIEIEVTGGAATETPTPAQAAPAAAADRAAPAAGAPSAGPSDEAQAMRDEVLDYHGRLGDLDHYQLLGIEPDASAGAIRKAYFKAAKRYHPDALTRLGLADIKTEANDVFSKIAEANEVLSDAGKRRDYDESLASGGGPDEVDVGRIAQAEISYRKGEILVRMGDFRGALEHLKQAVDLWPEEAAYQSDLGWAYYKKNPPEPERALDHLRRAAELAPGDSVVEFRLGVIERGS